MSGLSGRGHMLGHSDFEPVQYLAVQAPMALPTSVRWLYVVAGFVTRTSMNGGFSPAELPCSAGTNSLLSCSHLGPAIWRKAGVMQCAVQALFTIY